ncbi:MAG: hypothetical protein IJ489_00755 [Clostridia bacterium]|nr:hypothetical protein [Clostridia bacterium]
MLKDWENAHRLETDESYQSYAFNSRIPKDVFMKDGIVDEREYALMKKKILFIAKEANWYSAEETTDTFRERAKNATFWLQDVAFGRNFSTMFSKKIALLAHAVIYDNYTDIHTDHEILKKIAFINLNKRGGFAHCVWETLENYVRIYASYINRQIALISPDLIVCCSFGVKWLLDQYIELPPQSKVIAVYHPSYFALSYTEYLHQLECAIKNLPWCPENLHDKTNPIYPQTVKGIIFDTNKTYSQTATIEMLTNNKISAYSKATGFIDRFHYGDYVFYYVKGRGVVAAGQIISEEAISEDGNEKYKTVRLIVPGTAPSTEDALREISPKELKTLHDGRNFYLASTVKVPYLNQEKSERLIAVLQEKYGNT